ncbi:hypothetical protein TRSC58_07572 [Trypanosoma rangeli SC58]|uniref:Uncharacterized protein n=1 Tax=Trypanosoma rangeli SC58 TaxID=429131 RepID=A0A061IRK0_TRYRA|nr:hypothetical protein TRSC58_07572 [Trypanosoma rangeli SC58]
MLFCVDCLSLLLLGGLVAAGCAVPRVCGAVWVCFLASFALFSPLAAIELHSLSRVGGRRGSGTLRLVGRC